MSAADAYSAMASAPTGMQSSECASVPALEVTRVRPGLAGFQTDRGTAQMSAWLFTVAGSTGDIAFPALAPSAFWARSFESGWGNGGATISGDGRILTYGFTGGECDNGYKFAVAESKSAVAVVVAPIPNYGPMQACSAVGVIRKITVPLASPLGGRVLVDEKGRVESACPAGVSSC